MKQPKTWREEMKEPCEYYNPRTKDCSLIPNLTCGVEGDRFLCGLYESEYGSAVPPKSLQAPPTRLQRFYIRFPSWRRT